MRRFPTLLIAGALALSLPLLVTAKINGSVSVAAGQPADDASTVNGAIHVAAGAVVREASTVNGSIDLGDKAQANEISTVNGSIMLGSHSRVSGDIHAVNGHIQLDDGADVGGRLHNVNGTIDLVDAHIGGGIGSVNGDLTVGANSRVEGGILYDKPGGWIHWDSNSRDPLIVIGPHAVVRGTLEFRHEVVLKVSDSAQIGPVKGATVVKFSGATP